MEIKEIDVYVVITLPEQGGGGGVKYFKDKELAERYSKTEKYFPTEIDVRKYYISETGMIFSHQHKMHFHDNEWKNIFEKYDSIKSKLTEEELKLLNLV